MERRNILHILSILLIASCSSMQGLDPKLLSYDYRPRRSVFFFSESPDRSDWAISDCTSGHAKRCVDVAAGLLREDKINGARKFFEIGCNLDYGKACYGAGRLDFEKKKLISAEGFYEKGCRLKFGPSCFALAELRYEDDEKTDDEYQLYGLACDMKGDYGCVRLGEVFYDGGNLGLAQFYFHRSCSLKNELGCYNAGHVYYKQKKLQKSLEMLRLSCKYGQAQGCYQMARHYGHQRDDDKVFFFLKEAFKNKYDNWERVEFDSNFSHLRKRIAFRDLIDSFLLSRRQVPVTEANPHQIEEVESPIELNLIKE